MLSQHPANLILRFVLEIAALVTIGRWGWGQHQGVLRWLLGIGLPLALMAAWAVLRSPGEPAGQPKHAVVPVPGRARLALEALYFGLAVWTAFAGGQGTLGIALALALLLHYAWSVDRVIWLYRH